MNKKGMTLVELVVTFALVLVVVVGLYNLILEIKLQLEEKQIIKDVTEYSATINNKIHYDILRHSPFAILYSSKGVSWEHRLSTNDNISLTGGNYTITSNKTGINSLTVTKNELSGNNYCKNIFPCFVYFYNGGTSVEYKAISIKKIRQDGDDMGLGIIYNGIFEEIPNQERGKTGYRYGYIDRGAMNEKIREETGTKDNYFKIDINNKIFTMVYPIYIVDDTINYGFKITYPLQ